MARFSWLRNRKKTAAEVPFVSPIPLGNLSNGEYFHQQTEREAKLEKLVLTKLDENARKVGMDRREFASTAMGMATALYVVHTAGCSDKSDNSVPLSGNDAGTAQLSACKLPEAATLNDDAACEVLNADDFIFDIQTHHFDENGDWRNTNLNYVNYLNSLARQLPSCAAHDLTCYSRDRYVSNMFMNSDTTMTVLSSWPAVLCGDDTSAVVCGLPLDNDAIAATRDSVNLLAHSQRVVNHCFIMPNDPGGLDQQFAIMEMTCDSHRVGGWKCYPAFGPPPPGGSGGVGYFLDDPDTGIPFIQKGLSLGINCFSIHKGLPIPGFDVEHNKPLEIGRVAKMFPDANLIIYHSGICANTQGQTFCGAGAVETFYDETSNIEDLKGVDMFIRALVEAGVGPGSNVFAETGSAWVQVMNNPNSAGHFLGKLLKYVGPKNICWGTDCILYGSPQPQIAALRAFTIPQDIVDYYEIPNLDDLVDGSPYTVRQHIFGINAARIYNIDVQAKRCAIKQLAMHRAKEEMDYEVGPGRFILDPGAGPKTQREFMEHARRSLARGEPA